MQTDVLTVGPAWTLRQVAALFTENHITGAPVVDERGGLVGVISETDLVRHDRGSAGLRVPGYHLQTQRSSLVDEGFQIEEPDYTRVSDVMTPSVFEVAETTPVGSVARLMVDKHIHRVIVTKNRKLKGIISSIDLLNLIASSNKERATDVSER